MLSQLNNRLGISYFWEHEHFSVYFVRFLNFFFLFFFFIKNFLLRVKNLLIFFNFNFTSSLNVLVFITFYKYIRSLKKKEKEIKWHFKKKKFKKFLAIKKLKMFSLIKRIKKPPWKKKFFWKNKQFSTFCEYKQKSLVSNLYFFNFLFLNFINYKKSFLFFFKIQFFFFKNYFFFFVKKEFKKLLLICKVLLKKEMRKLWQKKLFLVPKSWRFSVFALYFRRKNLKIWKTIQDNV